MVFKDFFFMLFPLAEYFVIKIIAFSCVGFHNAGRKENSPKYPCAVLNERNGIFNLIETYVSCLGCHFEDPFS